MLSKEALPGLLAVKHQLHAASLTQECLKRRRLLMEEEEEEDSAAFDLSTILASHLVSLEEKENNPGRGRGVRVAFNIRRPVLLRVGDYRNDPQRFRELTRFTLPEFDELVLQLTPLIQSRGRKGPETAYHSCKLDIPERIMVWLMSLRGGPYLSDLQLATGWDKSSICADFHYMNVVTASLLAPLIRWPDAAERLVMKNSFPESTVLRGRCVGYLDATCLFVRRPSINQRRFWRGDKRRHCFVAQAVVDPHGRIRHLVVGFPGGISNDRGLYISTDLYLNASAYHPRSISFATFVSSPQTQILRIVNQK